jgi:hypothetical protein
MLNSVERTVFPILFILLILVLIQPAHAQPIPNIELSGPGWRASWGESQSDFQLQAGSSAHQVFFVDNSGPGAALIMSLRLYWDPNVDGNWQIAAQSDPNVLLPDPGFSIPSRATEYLWKFDLQVPASIKANDGQVWTIFECAWATTLDAVNPSQKEITRTEGPMLQIQGAQSVQVNENIPPGFVQIPSLQLGHTWAGAQAFSAPAGSETNFQFTITDNGPGDLQLVRGEFYMDPTLTGQWQLIYQENFNNYHLTQSQGIAWTFNLTIPSSVTAPFATNGVPQASATVQVIYSSADGTHAASGTFNLPVPGATIRETASQPTTSVSTTPVSSGDQSVLLVLSGVTITGVVIIAGIIIAYRRSRVKEEKPLGKLETAKPSLETEKTKQSQVRTIMYCSQCGAQITRDSKFCKECGTKQI